MKKNILSLLALLGVCLVSTKAQQNMFYNNTVGTYFTTTDIEDADFSVDWIGELYCWACQEYGEEIQEIGLSDKEIFLLGYSHTDYKLWRYGLQSHNFYNFLPENTDFNMTDELDGGVYYLFNEVRDNMRYTAVVSFDNGNKYMFSNGTPYQSDDIKFTDCDKNSNTYWLYTT